MEYLEPSNSQKIRLPDLKPPLGAVTEHALRNSLSDDVAIQKMLATDPTLVKMFDVVQGPPTKSAAPLSAPRPTPRPASALPPMGWLASDPEYKYDSSVPLSKSEDALERLIRKLKSVGVQGKARGGTIEGDGSPSLYDILHGPADVLERAYLTLAQRVQPEDLENPVLAPKEAQDFYAEMGYPQDQQKTFLRKNPETGKTEVYYRNKIAPGPMTMKDFVAGPADAVQTVYADAPQQIDREDTSRLELAPQSAQDFFKEMGYPQDQSTTFAYKNPETGEMSVYKRARATTERTIPQQIGASADSLGRYLSATMLNSPAVGAATTAAREAGVLGESGTVGTFAGIKSKTANLKKLEAAKQFEAAGAKPEEIWTQTGWFRGADDQWRYEIPDNTMKADLRRIKESPETSVTSFGKSVEHPELKKAYPNLDMYIGADPNLRHGEAVYFPNENFIHLSPSNISASGDVVNLRGGNPLLHEMQHAVAAHEGWQGGASPEHYMPQHLLTDNNIDDEYKQAYAKAFDKYRRTVGEVEARNTEARRKMDALQRSRSFPEWTQDVRREDVIKKAKGGLIPKTPKSKVYVPKVNPIEKKHYRQTMNNGALTQMRTKTRNMFK